MYIRYGIFSATRLRKGVARFECEYMQMNIEIYENILISIRAYTYSYSILYPQRHIPAQMRSQRGVQSCGCSTQTSRPRCGDVQRRPCQRARASLSCALDTHLQL